MQTLPLSSDGQYLLDHLHRNNAPQAVSTDTVHVDGVGGRLYFAYEQLRNAAEYSEQHLLLRRSIERFLQRNINFRRLQPLGMELVIELTQSRYIKNDSIPRKSVKQIDEILQGFVELYHGTLTAGERNRTIVAGWILQSASVHIEQVLIPQPRTRPFVDFAYHHYFESIDDQAFADKIEGVRYQMALYCAVHRAILKSDIATVRAYALASQIIPQKSEDHAAYFVQINHLIDELFNDRVTNGIMRLVSQHGAPMRILREVVISQSNAEELLSEREALLSRIRSTTAEQYALVKERLNNGISRSVAFVAITKILIGLAIEIPYDLIRYGTIIWPPLILNIVFPPLYMLTLGLGIRPPNRKNSELIERHIDRILYQGDHKPVHYRLRRRVSSPALNRTFNVLYAGVFVVWIALLAWILKQLEFNIVSGVIFFIFLSTVSFLGFRLTQTARELEMIESRRGALNLITDFLYTPFIRIGHWLSDRYAQVNVVARVLDILIEMPLKFGLRFMRQWVGFLRDKQEEM